MRAIIFESFDLAESFQQKIFQRGLPWGGAGTTRYVIPIKHPIEDRWAIEINDRAWCLLNDAEKAELQNLTLDWFPVPITYASTDPADWKTFRKELLGTPAFQRITQAQPSAADKLYSALVGALVAEQIDVVDVLLAQVAAAFSATEQERAEIDAVAVKSNIPIKRLQTP